MGVDFLSLPFWLALLMAVFIPLELRWAIHPRRVFRKAFFPDLVYFALSGLLPKLLLTVPLTMVAAGFHDWMPSAYYAWLAGLPLVVRLGASLLVGELCAYWAHRTMHEIPWLWRFHALHHDAEEMDWLVSTRAHPVDLVFTRLCFLLPLYLLGLAQPMGTHAGKQVWQNVDFVPALATAIGTFWGYFIHANLDWRFGWLELFVSSPAFHHWHHTNDGPEAYDKNFSPTLPWMDKIFGTYYLPADRWPATYGTDSPSPKGIAAQLLYPLTPAAPSTSQTSI